MLTDCLEVAVKNQQQKHLWKVEAEMVVALPFCNPCHDVNWSSSGLVISIVIGAVVLLGFGCG